jgi:hypothetical protein
MPTLISRGAASAKAFGLTNGSLNLTTTTFTSNGTWVAPAGVALVLVLSGRGQDGSPQPYNYTTQYWASPNPNTQANAAYLQWDSIYNLATTNRSSIVSYIGSSGPASFLGAAGFFIGTGDTWSQYIDSYENFSGLIVNSVSGITTQGNAQTTGNVVRSSLASGVNGFNFVIDFTIPGFLGASSTAISQTFPGGNGGPAPVTTFNNIAVTPGASYPIVVASGGYVTIQYFAP